MEDGLLEYEHSATHTSFKGWQFEDFHVTPAGKYFIQSFFGGLASTIRVKKKYNDLIDEVEASSELKNFLKGLYGKLKAETQEEIARTLLSKVKEYGVPLLVILIKMASGNSETSNVVHT